MKRKIHKAARAERDLIRIWDYSFRQCSEAPADKHLDELDAGISVLADNPQLGLRRDEVRIGYPVLFIGTHAVYYTVSRTKALVVLVLHDQMDSGRHL